MNEDAHGFAKRLILQDCIEHISPKEREWLQQHLQGCAACAHLAYGTGQAARSLRTVSVPLPPALASRTQLRIYLRLQELQRHERGSWALWLSCALSWALGIASARYVWRVFESIGHSTGVSNLIWHMTFVLWWALPALIATAILVIEKMDRSSGGGQLGIEPSYANGKES